MGTGTSLHELSWAFPDERYERSTWLWLQCAMREGGNDLVGLAHSPDRPALPVCQEMISTVSVGVF